MKMRTFDLAVYEYEEFIKEAQDYVMEEVRHDGQGWFFFRVLNHVKKHVFTTWKKRNYVVIFVIDGKASRKIPYNKRITTIEDEDAAVILY